MFDSGINLTFLKLVPGLLLHISLSRAVRLATCQTKLGARNFTICNGKREGREVGRDSWNPSTDSEPQDLHSLLLVNPLQGSDCPDSVFESIAQ